MQTMRVGAYVMGCLGVGLAGVKLIAATTQVVWLKAVIQRIAMGVGETVPSPM